MNNELLLLIKKHTDTLIEQTKTKPQETFEFEMIKQMETFPFSPPINLFEEGEWLLAVTSLEATKSLFNITNEYNSFPNTIPSHWYSRGGEDTMKRQRELKLLRAQNDIELHVQDIKKRGNQIKRRDKENNLSYLDTHRNEMIK